jgi:hypothetical protein
MTYLQFHLQLRGFDFFCKKTNKQIFRYQLFYWGLTPDQCKNKFTTIFKTK